MSEPRARWSTTDDLDDAHLWARLQARDEYAFRVLFTRHNKVVYNFAFRHCASWSMAEDVTQSTFASLWRRARTDSVDDLRGDSARPVLLATARNEASNAMRASKRHLRVVDKVERTACPESDNVADWVADESAMRQINEILQRVPDNQQVVIEMVAWAGLEMTEVATALGVLVGTVKSRLNRARRKLATTEIAAMLGGGL
ncbi:RNA polymerase sigma factor [Naumannella halotolerans]|uniref:RNA polymerase sigma factor n=1 Tax=Naumannella halotolerans TaxID=993414 RepID=UPI00370DD52D